MFNPLNKMQDPCIATKKKNLSSNPMKSSLMSLGHTVTIKLITQTISLSVSSC